MPGAGDLTCKSWAEGADEFCAHPSSLVDSALLEIPHQHAAVRSIHCTPRLHSLFLSLLFLFSMNQGLVWQSDEPPVVFLRVFAHVSVCDRNRSQISDFDIIRIIYMNTNNVCRFEFITLPTSTETLKS